MIGSVTIKAAWIIGILGILGIIIGAIITGCFGLLKDRNGSRTDNRVTSHEQSGGITAKNVTINQYFDKQPPDEKQALEKSLLAKYPLGYALFAVDGKTIHIPESLSFTRDFVIDWTGSKISKLETNWIEFYPPQIIYKPTMNEVGGVFNFRIRRKIGFILPYPMLPSWTNAFIEVLDDKSSFAVLVLGFKK